MRSGSSHNEFIIHEGIFCGVNLGWDFTSEHEWGIKGIEQTFGLEGVANGVITKRLGIEARRVTLLPPSFKIYEKGEYTYLISAKYGGTDDDINKKNLDSIIGAYWPTEKDKKYWKDREEKILQTAWDEGSFGIAVKGKEARKYLKELFKAFNENDAVITFGHDGNPFSNAGLMLVIASRLPKDYVDAQKEADLDRIALNKASDKTGIIERLEKAGRRYYACSPKWAKEIKSTVNGEIKTKHNVIYWLNPQEQNKYDHGWWTVEILDQWIAGKGPVMKEIA